MRKSTKISIKGGEQTGEYQIYMNGVKEKQENVNVTANGKKLHTGDNMYYTLYKKR